MTSFLERYLQGECEPVWDELVALGEEVQIEPLHADALAVARETMRRARSNIEALIPRLQKLGYTFGYDWLPANERDFAKNKPPLYALPGPNVPARLAELERVAEGIPLSIRAWYEAIGAVNFVGIPPLHWPLPPWREGLQRFFEEHSHYPDWMIKQQWQEGETKWVGFHTACRQFIETHPSYPDYTLPELWHFEQDHPGLVPLLRQIGTWLDPLQVWSLEDQLLNAELTGYQEWEATYSEAPDFPRCICIAPDNLTKQEISGGSGYEIVVPCLAADARLEGEPHQTTFVNYLRLCFRWGGLPGLGDYPNPPQEDLAYLTKELLPM